MTAPPVVLLHGLATNAERTWVDTGWIDIIADSGRSAHAPDLLGHGTNAQPTDPAAYASFEDEVLSGLPDGQVDAIGFSLGARTLLVLAARHPERFGRLVVAGVGANLFRHDGSSALLADALERGDETNPMVHHFRQLAATCGQSMEALVALLRRPEPPIITEALLADVTHNTLVVLGDNDFAGPAAPLVEALPNCRFVELRNVDHFATPKSMAFMNAAFSHLDI